MYLIRILSLKHLYLIIFHSIIKQLLFRPLSKEWMQLSHRLIFTQSILTTSNKARNGPQVVSIKKLFMRI